MTSAFTLQISGEMDDLGIRVDADGTPCLKSIKTKTWAHITLLKPKVLDLPSPAATSFYRGEGEAEPAFGSPDPQKNGLPMQAQALSFSCPTKKVVGGGLPC